MTPLHYPSHGKIGFIGGVGKGTKLIWYLSNYSRKSLEKVQKTDENGQKIQI